MKVSSPTGYNHPSKIRDDAIVFPDPRDALEHAFEKFEIGVTKVRAFGR